MFILYPMSFTKEIFLSPLQHVKFHKTAQNRLSVSEREKILTEERMYLNIRVPLFKESTH